MEVKICGLTKVEEADYLVQEDSKADYAGFVLFEKSKRYVTVDKACDIKNKLPKDIKTVAVVVSPELPLIRDISESGFDIMQVHKNLSEEMIDASNIPIWYAFNISDAKELEDKRNFLHNLSENQANKITGIVIDGAEYGSGKTFDWTDDVKEKISDILKNRKFILAGGLNCDNVSVGINIFKPDIVDVSSGVEGENGKDKELVKEFIKNAKIGE